MAITKTIQATVKNRTDTAANWTQKNPVLAEGEIIVVQTSAGETRLKIGDGVKTFTQLPYIDEQIYNNVVTSVNGETGDITLPGDFVINATLADNDNCTTDKTYTQIQEAVQAGKKVVVKIRVYGFDFVLPLIGKFESDYMFTAVFNPANTVAMQFAVVIGEQGSGIFKCRIPTYNSDGNSLQQVTMETDPTEDMQIATKKYVDDHVSADVYVDFWPTGTGAEYNGNLNGYQVELATDQTFDAIFDSIKAGNKIVARLYKDADKSESPVSSVDTAVAGNKEFGSIHFQFVTAYTGEVAGFPFIGEGIMMLKIETSTAIFLVANHNVLPTPNADGTDNGKVPIINGIQWELKKPPAGSPDAVLYTPQTLTDAQKKQARENVDASISDFSFTATIQDFPTCTLDKTFNQIQEAISKGKRVFAFLKISDDESYILTLWKSTLTEIQFAAFDYNYDLNRAQAYKLSVSADKSELAAGSAVMLTAANTLNQVEMAAGPSFDMEIATKKYVDDHATGGTNMGITGATVGQIPKIKAVDSNGIPTEWEAATFSGSSSDYVINVTLDTKQSSIGNWVLGYSCTCDKTYAEVLAAYQSGAKVLAHVIRNKEITLSDGSKRTIPIINEAPLTRYIAAQNLLVFDYVHNATDLSVSSGGLTYTTGDSGDSMICYVATYQFAFGATDTSADSVQIPTTTKVQDMIDASVGDINTNTYTIQVSNTAPAAGTSDKIITYVVEEATAG